MLRDSLIQFLSAYNPRLRIVYCEAPLPTLRARNAQRPRPVPDLMLEKLLNHLDIPDRTEAHEILYPGP